MHETEMKGLEGNVEAHAFVSPSLVLNLQLDTY